MPGMHRHRARTGVRGMTAPRAILANTIREHENALGDVLGSSPEAVAHLKWNLRERRLEGHRTPVWESLPDIVREELIQRERLVRRCSSPPSS